MTATAGADRPRSVVVLGGGTAGWIAALTLQGIEDICPAMSWHCLLGGYGNYPGVRQGGDGRVDMADIHRFAAGCASNFPSHAASLVAMNWQLAQPLQNGSHRRGRGARATQ